MEKENKKEEEIKKIEDKYKELLKPKNLREAVRKAVKQTFDISWMMVKIYIPVSLFTVFLKQIGFIALISPLFSPIMELMGLPGETALTLVAGFLNVLYAAIGTMIAFDLTARQITILGVVLGISHNLILETVILTKLKIATVRIAFFRAFMGIITGILMNLLLPQNIPSTMFFSSIVQKSSSSAAVAKFSWISTFEKIAITCIQIVIIIFIIMLIYEFLVFMKLGRKKIKNKIKFIPNSIGLSDNAFGPWMVGLFAGILYGAGILFQFEKDKKLSHKDSCLITVFLVIAHAIIEDIMIFAIVGGNFWWIISIRIFMAIFITKLLSINDLYKKFLWIGLLESK